MYEFSETGDMETNRELAKVEEAFRTAAYNYQLLTLYEAPPRPRQGMIVRADGATWNPGDGEGIYEYDTTLGWRKLQYVVDDLTLDTLSITQLVQFTALDSEPGTPVNGMLAYADGSGWDPGSGAGLYFRNASTWVFLG